MTRKERQLLAAVENSAFAWEVREFVRERGHYEGGANWILTNINERAAETSKAAKEWPKTANQAGKLLKKFKPGLELKGVKVSYSRHGRYGRLWLLEDENYTAPRFLPARGRPSLNRLLSSIHDVTP